MGGDEKSARSEKGLERIENFERNLDLKEQQKVFFLGKPLKPNLIQCNNQGIKSQVHTAIIKPFELNCNYF